MPKLSKEEVEIRLEKTFKQKVKLIGEYVNRRTPLKLECQECGYIWDSSCLTALYGDNHECPKCGEHSKKQIEFHCSYCGKEIYRTPSQIKANKSGYFYCSKECGNKHKNLIREKSGEWLNASSTYRRKAFNTYDHKCCVCGWDEDERVLEVHHKDENRDNNLIENLCIICPICHRKITLGYYQLTEDFRLIPSEKS